MARRKVSGGRYELDEPALGRGGMAEVYVGRDIKLERQVAVKFVRFLDDRPEPESVRRFVRDSRIIARLEHPGVPAFYDVGTHEDRPYLVMQRVRGISVSDLVADQGPLPIRRATAIAAQTCSVLLVAYQESLVPRDLKPSNLMLCPDGTLKRVRGRPRLARLLPDHLRGRRPRYADLHGARAGRGQPQGAAHGPVRARLHALRDAGRAPGLRSLNAVRPREAGCAASAKTRAGATACIPPELDRLVSELLEKRPEDRPSDADEASPRLFPFVRELTPLPGRSTRRPRRTRCACMPTL